jgi:2-polyprenyl-6-methoxyphenol hydroxylase-like FAD-dependent oxidoreductase
MSISSTSVDVLVVGAGPTGLTLACELRRHGVSVRVIDRASGPSPLSRAIIVHARTLEVLDAMGVADELVQRGRELSRTNVYANGKRIVSIDGGELDTPFPYVLGVSQHETESVLRGLLARLGGEITWDAELTRLSQDTEGVRATCRRLTEDEKIHTKWLVGCDGAHSAVRKALSIPFEGEKYPEEFILADVKLEWDLPDDELHVFLSEDGVLVVAAMGQGRHRLIGSTSAGIPADASSPPTLDDFRTIVAHRAGVPATVSDPAWTAHFRVHRRLVPYYRDRRVFLAGDAAHIHSPAGGQGMNTGIQDAHNLAWKLALAIRGRGGQAMLDSYQKERRAIAEGVLRGTDLAFRVATVRNPIARAVRDRLAGVLSSLEVVQQRMRRSASGLAISYQASPIVAEDVGGFPQEMLQRDPESASFRDRQAFAAAPAPGDRAPDGTATMDATGEPTRLFELFRSTKHTLLLFDGRAATTGGYKNLDTIGREVRDRYGDWIAVCVVVPASSRPAALGWDGPLLLDVEGDLEHRYGAGAECLYLIRPDGYIGYRCQPASGERLLAYLAKLLPSA